MTTPTSFNNFIKTNEPCSRNVDTLSLSGTLFYPINAVMEFDKLFVTRIVDNLSPSLLFTKNNTQIQILPHFVVKIDNVFGKIVNMIQNDTSIIYFVKIF